MDGIVAPVSKLTGSRRCRLQRREITVEGIVQGVGFRPFIHRIARRWGILGTVHNFTGGVVIDAEGTPENLDAFVRAISEEKPPLAVIDLVRQKQLQPIGHRSFSIVPSREAEGGVILISPDVATCDDCLRELQDPSDRRFRHPFINCTNCGPRFTIVRSVPYDRKNTSMARFPMCPKCQAEYDDIENRRYHAQPNACPECGPTLSLLRADYRLDREEALKEACRMLQAGEIVAVKGLGGFHLACDATNEQAVRELRRRKRRDEKPFAIMSASPDVVRSYCEVTEQDEELLKSPQRPIILLRKGANGGAPVAPSVAPDSKYLGVLLPYTPVHHLLFVEGGFAALVMTSGNLSDEPLATQNSEALQRLAGIADAFLLHDRGIEVGCDDSIVRPTKRGPIVMRRARGYVPFPVRLGHKLGTVLAVGGHLKNTFCLTVGENAFLSQHMGDLEDAQTLAFFERSVSHFESILRVQPDVVAHDMHPGYLSTQYARRLAEERGLPLEPVQHHHAHIASCMIENGLRDRVIGIACDGTGYGADGTVWGCEVITADLTGFRRRAHLKYIPMPGGEAAIKEPWRMAAAYLYIAFGPEFADELKIDFCRRLPREKWDFLRQMIERDVNCPLASSAGRLFDAVASLLGLRDVNAYEGQAPMILEARSGEASQAYPFEVSGETLLEVDPLPAIRAIVADLEQGVDVAVIGAKFHNMVVASLAEAAYRVAESEGITDVALSGGTFQNERILLGLCAELERRGLRPHIQREVPCNDGGLSLGQAVVASARWK